MSAGDPNPESAERPVREATVAGMTVQRLLPLRLSRSGSGLVS
jgi:hypothetical protein